MSVHKQLISQLSPTLAEKMIAVDERGLTSADGAEYNNGTKRTRYSSVPASRSSLATTHERAPNAKRPSAVRVSKQALAKKLSNHMMR